MINLVHERSPFRPAPVFLSRARRLRLSPAHPVRAAAQSGPVFAQAPDPVRVPGQGGAAGATTRRSAAASAVRAATALAAAIPARF